MATAAHKRTASSISSISKSRSPSIPSLFITNLKLLNLDLLADWPALSTLSFGTHDARTRIRSVEWSLYQLFLVYDPRMTAEKLQPFFPPLESLQSVNLRAALHRCLAELKKNGVLGRDAVLRKTMLDDCTGDKFWELCLIFSSVVLRKATLDSRPRSTQPAAQRYAAAQILERGEKESLLPLAVAHKVALTKVLETKTQKRASFMQLSSVLSAKEDELLERVNAIDKQKPVVTSAQHAEDLHIIERALTSSSLGKSAFTDAIVNGDPIRSGDIFLLQSKQDFLGTLDVALTQSDTRRDSGVLEDLQQKAKAQKVRVEQWQALYDQLRCEIPRQDEQRQHTRAPLNYDAHLDLGIEEMQDLPIPSSNKSELTRAYMSRYDEILTSMRDELRRSHSVLRESEPSLDPRRRPPISLDAVAGAANTTIAPSPSRRSMSPIVRFRPGFGRRVSSQSRSYQQPRVVSQRELVPLKAEVFSPVKSARQGTAESQASSTAATQPAHIKTTDFAGKRTSQESIDTPTIDSGIGLGVTLTDSPNEITVSGEENLRFEPAEQRSTLTERTRMSMILPKVATTSPPQRSPADEEQHDTLLARTRQSMSARGITSYSEQPSPVMTGSQLSVLKTRVQDQQSQADTNSLDVAAHATNLRDITPREKLFEADAEASSVFKSRPKIATSPVLSPLRAEKIEQ